MDQITRAVELTKARMLELNGAFLQVLCHTSNPLSTYEDLRARIEQIGREWTQECKEIREQVKEDEAMETVEEAGESDLGDLCQKQVQEIKGMFSQRLRLILKALDPGEVEAVVSSMDEVYDTCMAPVLRSMLETTTRFDRKIEEINTKLKKMDAEDDGESWKRSSKI